MSSDPGGDEISSLPRAPDSVRGSCLFTENQLASCWLVSCASVCKPSRARLLETPWSMAPQAPLSMEFSGRNTAVGCHALLQGTSPTQGKIHLVSPALAGGFFTTAPPVVCPAPNQEQNSLVPCPLRASSLPRGTDIKPTATYRSAGVNCGKKEDLAGPRGSRESRKGARLCSGLVKPVGKE